MQGGEAATTPVKIRRVIVTGAIAERREIHYALGMAFLRTALFSLSALTLGVAACSDDGGEGPTPDAPQGNCPSGEVFFTGELVDWDSTNASFRGVNEATFTVVGEPSRADQTSPNGRFELCLAKAATTKLTVDATSVSTYLDGVAVAELDVLAAGAIPSFRSFTTNREMQFTPRIALGKAQVFVDVAGAQREVSLDAAYEAAFAFDGSRWAEGKTGRAVFFVNVEPRGGTATAAMSGSFLGGKDLPTTANSLTFVTLFGK